MTGMESRTFGQTIFFLALMFMEVRAICMPEHPQASVCRSHFVLKAKILSLDWEKDSKTTEAPKTTTAPVLTLPKPEDGETDFVVAKKPDPSLQELFRSGKNIKLTETDILGEPAMLPFYRARFIRVELQKLIKGGSLLTRKIGVQLNIRYTTPFKPPKYEVGKTYLLTGFKLGKELAMNECNWFSEWDKLTSVMHYGLRRYYWMYCGCKIKDCIDKKCIKKSPRECLWEVSFDKIGFEKIDFLSRNRVCMVKCNKCDWYDPKKRERCY